MAQKRLLCLFCVFTLAVQIGLWLQLRTAQAQWLNVPPVPSENGALAFALGDRQFAYRSIGVMLQNMGDEGGRSTSLHDYDYDKLGAWFDLADAFDPHSDYLPILVAFYFGAVEDPQKLIPVTGYLHRVGNSVEGEKWRWLAQAVYLARYKMNDMEKAKRWADELAAIDKPGIPLWARQMPAFVRNAEGDKQAAYDIMVGILKNGKNKLPRQEITVMIEYICKRILTPEEAEKDALCEGQ